MRPGPIRARLDIAWRWSLDHGEPLVALLVATVATAVGIFGHLEAEELITVTLGVLIVLAFALLAERTRRLDASRRLERIGDAVDLFSTGAPYLILESESVWNLQDDGSAHVFRRKKLRFAHDDAILVYDWYQSDGKSTKPVYKPEGSKEVHKFVSDGRRFTVVALDRPRNRGEECEFVSERTSERAFEKNPDRVIARALDPTGLLSITIRWPKNRPPKEVRIIRRTDADRGMPTSVRPHKARDGRMEETVKVLRPQLGERVGMEWDWEPSPKPVSQATPEEAPATIAAEAQASPNGPSSSVPQPAPPADS